MKKFNVKLILASALVLVSFSILANAFVNYLNTMSSPIQFSRGRASVDTVAVTAPAADDVLAPGQTYTISWTGGGAFPEVAFYLYQNGTSSPGILIREHAPNTGSYSWTVPAGYCQRSTGDPCGSNFQIMIRLGGWAPGLSDAF